MTSNLWAPSSSDHLFTCGAIYLPPHCNYVAKSEVACEEKEAFLGFDNVRNDRRAAAISF